MQGVINSPWGLEKPDHTDETLGESRQKGHKQRSRINFLESEEASSASSLSSVVRAAAAASRAHFHASICSSKGGGGGVTRPNHRDSEKQAPSWRSSKTRTHLLPWWVTHSWAASVVSSRSCDSAARRQERKTTGGGGGEQEATEQENKHTMVGWRKGKKSVCKSTSWAQQRLLSFSRQPPAQFGHDSEVVAFNQGREKSSRKRHLARSRKVTARCSRATTTHTHTHNMREVREEPKRWQHPDFFKWSTVIYISISLQTVVRAFLGGLFLNTWLFSGGFWQKDKKKKRYINVAEAWSHWQKSDFLLLITQPETLKGAFSVNKVSKTIRWFMSELLVRNLNITLKCW